MNPKKKKGGSFFFCPPPPPAPPPRSSPTKTLDPVARLYQQKQTRCKKDLDRDSISAHPTREILQVVSTNEANKARYGQKNKGRTYATHRKLGPVLCYFPHIYSYTYTYIYIYVFIFIFIYIYIVISIFIFISILYLPIYLLIYICIMYVYLCIYIYIYIYIL